MNTWNIHYQHCNIPLCAYVIDGDPASCTVHGFYRMDPPGAKTLLERLSATYTFDARTFLGMMLFAIGIGGITGPMIPKLRMETSYAYQQLNQLTNRQINAVESDKPLPKAVPVVFAPLKTPSGDVIEPVNTSFSLVIPKIGVNAEVIPGVDPSSKNGYTSALEAGVAHANTSFYPDQDGTVYLFSHSTNYDWFVKDLNAVFYLVKNLEKDDVIVLMYKNKRYTYKITSKKVVSPKNVSYLIPYAGKRNLILQTCWPPGDTTQRLLIFGDLIEENGKAI